MQATKLDRPITVLLSGAPGTGKSATRRQARRGWLPHFGETAAMDTDDIYQIVDPHWTLASEPETWARCADLRRHNLLVLTRNLIQHQIRAILIVGNALYDHAVVKDYVAELAPVSHVFHFTLNPDLSEVVRRVAQRGDLDQHPADGLTRWAALIQQHAGPWTRQIDNTHLSVEQTLDVMRDCIVRGKGRALVLVIGA